jgi:hypothetical protein
VGNGRGPYNGRKERRRDRALVGYAFLFFVFVGFRFPVLWFMCSDLSPVFVACVSFLIYLFIFCYLYSCCLSIGMPSSQRNGVFALVYDMTSDLFVR